MDKKIVCSHFVHAVLYSVLQKGHFRTATLDEFDKFFMISPSQLLRLAYEGSGLFRGHQVEIIGVHHDSRFIPWRKDDLKWLLKYVDINVEFESKPSMVHPQRRKRWQETQGRSREFASKSALEAILDGF